MKLIEIIAQAAAPTSAPANSVTPPPYVQYGQFVIFAVIIYVFVFLLRPKKKGPKRDEMLAQLKKGDEIQTIGGEFGRVVDVRDDRVLLKVDETSNTKIWYSRNSIHRIVTEEKTEGK